MLYNIKIFEVGQTGLILIFYLLTTLKYIVENTKTTEVIYTGVSDPGVTRPKTSHFLPLPKSSHVLIRRTFWLTKRVMVIPNDL